MAANPSTSHALDYAKSLLGDLPEHWRYARVGDLEDEGIIEDVQDGNHGERHPKSSDYVSTGVPFIMAKDIVNNRLDLFGCSFISREQADSLRIGFARPGDVLLTHKATMGRVAIVPEDYEYVMLTPQVTYYRIRDKKQLDSRYLKYAFISPRFQHQLNASSDQSTRKFIGITAQRDLWFPLPPGSEQVRIAETLGSLDDKIELNRRMNETLEAMARRLFKSWFIDFDPVHAKAALRREHPKFSNADISRRALPNMVPEIAELFPDSFEDAALGFIPKGWKSTRINEVSETNGWTLGTSDELEQVDYIEISQVMKGDVAEITRYQRGKEPSRARRRLRHGDVVLSTVRPDRGAYFITINPPPSLIASTGFAVFTSTHVPWSWMACALTLPEVSEHLGHQADGGAYPAVNPSLIGKIEYAIPDCHDVLNAFHSIASEWYLLSDANRSEVKRISETRDKLLPRLLSGELSVTAEVA